MADWNSHRPHNKRNGLTDNIKHILLKAKRTQDEENIVKQLIDRMETKTARGSSYYSQNHVRAGKQRENGLESRNMGGQGKGTKDLGISVVRNEEKADRNSTKQLQKALSLDKLNFNVNSLSRTRRSKKQRSGLLGKNPLLTSKRNTEYSSQSQQEALKAQNQRIRELCASEQERLAKLEKLIAIEQKTQLLKRHMYEQNIERLRKIAALKIFSNEEIGEMESGSYDQACDCISIHSH